MKRILTTAAIAATLSGGAMAGHQANAESPASHLPAAGKPEQTGGWREAECRFQGLTPETWAQREVVATIRCAVEHWAVPRGSDGAVRTAACESGLRADALSPSGTYAGLFQHIRSAFASRSRLWNPKGWEQPLSTNPFNARANAVTSIRMAHALGWGQWPYCGYV